MDTERCCDSTGLPKTGQVGSKIIGATNRTGALNAYRYFNFENASPGRD